MAKQEGEHFYGLGKEHSVKQEEFYGLGKYSGHPSSGNVVLGRSDRNFNVPNYPMMLGPDSSVLNNGKRKNPNL